MPSSSNEATTRKDLIDPALLRPDVIPIHGELTTMTSVKQIEVVLEESTNSVDLAKSALLKEINRELESYLGVSTAKRYGEAQANIQGVDPLVAIAIVNTVISSMTLVWSIVSLRYRGTIVVEKKLSNGTSLTITTDKLSKAELHRLVEDLEAEAENESIEALVLKLR